MRHGYNHHMDIALDLRTQAEALLEEARTWENEAARLYPVLGPPKPSELLAGSERGSQLLLLQDCTPAIRSQLRAVDEHWTERA